MIQAFKDVLAFELASGRPAPPDIAGEADSEMVDLAMNLIDEECYETIGAMQDVIHDLIVDDGANPSDLANVADGLADLIWVCNAAAIRLGIDLPAVWEEVRESNMAKFGEGGSIRDDGKILKPPGWVAPDVRGVIEAQRPIMETYGS